MSVYCCFVGVWIFSGTCAAADLFVGNFFGDDSDTLLCNGATGAFLNTFASPVEDAAGLKFGPDGNLYVAPR